MAAKNNRFRPISRQLLVGALGVCALLALAAFAGNPARSGAQSAPAQQTTPAPAPQNATAAPAPSATQPASAAAATLPRPPYPGMTPEEKREQQVAQECAQLLKLATDLKAQVDKTRKDELSVTVVRKATELEQMAHKLRNGTTLSTSNE